MRFFVHQRVFATENLRFGILTNIPRCTPGTIVDITGMFANTCLVRWDNGYTGQVKPERLIPACWIDDAQPRPGVAGYALVCQMLLSPEFLTSPVHGGDDRSRIRIAQHLTSTCSGRAG